MRAGDQTHAKEMLRRYILAQRNSLTAAERADKSTIVCRRLEQLLRDRLEAVARQGRRNDTMFTVLAFMPVRSEIDIVPFILTCLRRGVPVAVPRTIPAERAIMFHRIDHPDETIESGAYGIREPLIDLPAVTDPMEIGMIIMPGAAFDVQGRRLGYGGGYYDRFLASVRVGRGELPLIVAPCFDLQVVRRVPVDEHDMKVHMILTEHREIDAS